MTLSKPASARRNEIQRSASALAPRRSGRLWLAIAASLALVAAAAAAMYWRSAVAELGSTAIDIPADETFLVEVVDHGNGQIRVTARDDAHVVKTIEVASAPPPRPLKLSGSILLDTNSMVRIHARFPGELTSIGLISPGDHPEENGHEAPRQLQYGDKVVKGQLLAVVWSKDIGEKKSEYVDAISKMDIDESLLKEYESVEPGVLAERTLIEARANYTADLVAVAKAERTLRSWRLTEDEIIELKNEARRVQNRDIHDVLGDRTWAVTEIRSPLNGLILEKNFNIGDLVDPTQDLFKIADLDRVQVMANAYEEDLPLLKNLDREHRKWKVDIKADPHDVPIAGTFDIIGTIIDPAQHAGAVMGWLDNPRGRLNIGEFITATIELPSDPTLVAIPTSALFAEDRTDCVFVETDAGQHEFAVREVAVVHRGRERTYVRATPLATERSRGVSQLSVGERVIVADVDHIAAKMKALRAMPENKDVQKITVSP